MYAIRSRNGKNMFRRSGVEFAAEAWTFQDEITEAQRDEPMLLILEVDSEDDPRLADLTPLLKEETQEEDAPADVSPNDVGALHEAQARQDELQQAKDQLAGEVVSLQTELADNLRERSALQNENDDLHSSLRRFAQTNEELGQERERLLAERESLLAEIEAFKAAQTPSAPAAASDGPAGPPATDVPAPEASGKEATGKSGKSAQAS